MDESEQNVLGADVGMVKEAGLLLREDNNPPGSVSEAFEHDPPFRSVSFLHPTGGWGRLAERSDDDRAGVTEDTDEGVTCGRGRICLPVDRGARL